MDVALADVFDFTEVRFAPKANIGHRQAELYEVIFCSQTC